MAHTVSMVVDKGTVPCVGTRLAVFLKPTMPFKAAGILIEPPVSEPRPMNAAAVATDTAAPEEEPPGTKGSKACAFALERACPAGWWDTASHAGGVP